jgi:hypothetical protein
MPRDPETEGGEYTLGVPKYRKIKIMLRRFTIHETDGGYIFVKGLLCRWVRYMGPPGKSKSKDIHVNRPWRPIGL